MGEDTTIIVKKNTRARLQAFRLTKRESYDEILNRLMDKEKGEP